MKPAPITRQKLRPGRGRNWRPDWRGIEHEQRRRQAQRERTPTGSDWKAALKQVRDRLDGGRP